MLIVGVSPCLRVVRHQGHKESSFPRLSTAELVKRESICFVEDDQITVDYAPLLRRALRAIRYANVRFGILPSQSRLRGNDVK
jgi:hypothetical protein